MVYIIWLYDYIIPYDMYMIYHMIYLYIYISYGISYGSAEYIIGQDIKIK